MKKPYLLLLAIIPLLSSCNKSGSFPNPFPGDTYTKTGFTIADDEKTTRPLTNAETNIVLNTIKEKDKYDNLILKMESYRYTREYTRAFAGEFKSGYNVKNIMKDEHIISIRQKEDGSGTLSTNKRERVKTTTSSTTLSQYSYGENKEEVKLEDYIFYTNDDTNKELENSAILTGKTSIKLRSKKTEKEKYVTVNDKKTLAENIKDKTTNISNFYITQSQYITTPDLKSGADAKGNVILVNATQNKHKDEQTGTEGIYTLKDGRSYQAMDNSLTVTKLRIDETTKDWYIVDYVRIYKETVITSEVIQPNVQVTKLKSPITLSFSEEKTKFSIVGESITEEIPDVDK